ncbi:MFS transporter [Marilutibacter alkalisoli]|uniref:MFS transporter n=1 Tax=Marilutibacter alkalisoli TaxID=2591633 RepID=A0A514BU93_9GAMM|nr:MFS transporter [Lysobacter alkalisoli]QDH70907.1 MFS transporter [Lysobacter alkalisoli]
MIATVRPLAALLAGVALLLMGSGLLGTLLAVRGRIEGFDDQTLGLVMSAYFVGFFLGTYAAPGLIQRIGHIRAFAFYTSLCAATVLLHAIFVSPWAWAVLRLFTGIALVGLYTVIESWLNVQAPPGQRSQLFAIYMAVNLLALAAGQWLIGLYPQETFTLFSLVAILICLAGLPVTASRMVQPELPPMPRLALKALFRVAPAATLGALLAGLAMGGFWGLAAVYATRIGLDVTGVAMLMSITIIGGAALQWPIGRLSDGGDRRTTLAVVCLLAAGTAMAMLLPSVPRIPSDLLLYGLWFAFGGLSFAIYPICMAHLLDHLPPEDTLSAGSSLLLLNGVGSAFGPALAGIAMTRFGHEALPVFFAITLVLAALVAGGRRLLRRRDTDHPTAFHVMLRTTPTAIELLPETGSADDDTTHLPDTIPAKENH